MSLLGSIDRKAIPILVVEDDDGDAKALRRAFQAAKFANPTLRAVDGIDALDTLKGTNGKARLPSAPILLVDMNMPRMNGIEFVKALRADKDLRHSIVFILTTSNRDEDRCAAYDLNVAGYVIKARGAEDFVNLVNLISAYLLIVELP